MKTKDVNRKMVVVAKEIVMGVLTMVIVMGDVIGASLS